MTKFFNAIGSLIKGIFSLVWKILYGILKVIGNIFMMFSPTMDDAYTKGHNSMVTKDKKIKNKYHR